MTIDDMAATFLAATPDGVMVADRDGVIRYWNAGCERIFGFAADEAQGQSLDIIIPETCAHAIGTAGRRRYVPARRAMGPAISSRCRRCARMARASRSSSRYCRSTAAAGRSWAWAPSCAM